MCLLQIHPPTERTRPSCGKTNSRTGKSSSFSVPPLLTFGPPSSRSLPVKQNSYGFLAIFAVGPRWCQVSIVPTLGFCLLTRFAQMPWAVSSVSLHVPWAGGAGTWISVSWRRFRHDPDEKNALPNVRNGSSRQHGDPAWELASRGFTRRPTPCNDIGERGITHVEVVRPYLSTPRFPVHSARVLLSLRSQSPCSPSCLQSR